MKAKYFILPFVFLMHSCGVKEQDKQKCRFESEGIVTGLLKIDDSFIHTSPEGPHAAGSIINKVIINNNDTIRYDNIYPRKFLIAPKKINIGDSIWVFKDWDDKLLLSSTPDIKAAIDSYIRFRESSPLRGLIVWLIAVGYVVVLARITMPNTQ
jgi:hypothetical protein